MTITADIQQLEPGNIVQLFEVDCTAIGGDMLRFHGHLQSSSIWWQGNEYKPWPIQATGFMRTTDAQQPTPTLTVGDIGGTISAICVFLDDMVGATVRRRRTLKRYLDAVNFPNGNLTADPTAEMLSEIWRVEQKSNEQPGLQVAFALSTPLDFGGQQLPARQIVSICQLKYRGPICGYTGSAYFDANDQPVSDPALDRCSFRTSGCECRFGINNPLPFGGFLSDTLS
ncbi:lambda family phage minor tail protein L [Paraburkholderia bannensis]|uniref:Lambda family phage minor tail protein L n=1 Tax=Paraburkholderia bannensis TaxID=765414 RepID=A0A7W9U1B7_9BURK|nr:MULTISPECIES: phage minor tail protein L [Paraburkholderia]MBB3260007.1 lambda family phage minor tail protein L [Paraburkholderia sp. WP4_3_2]MBB6105213.1 lambda family phage minor tail protein L [Paraburkholderia bannensis]